MNPCGPADSLGSGMGRPARHAALAFAAALAAWDASAAAVRWVARQCRRPAAGGRSGVAVRTAEAAPPDALPQGYCYAPSTMRRYRQITARFRAWCDSQGAGGGAAPDFAGFLATLTAPAGRSLVGPHGGRRDPRHLGLLRTTICAVRATLDQPPGPGLTAAIRLPPRSPPVPAAEAESVAALRRAARDVRERLLVMLACDLGLRPGQMAALRWSDVSLAQSQVCLNGRKGGLTVAIPASCRAGLEACSRGHAPGDFLFPSPRRGHSTAATVRTLQNVLRRLAERAGLAPGTTLTSLRKACLSNPPPQSPRGGLSGGLSQPLPYAIRPTAAAASGTLRSRTRRRRWRAVLPWPGCRPR